MLKKLIFFVVILIIISATAGSCSRRTYSGYNGPNRSKVKPHKEWKKPKSRYIKPKKKHTTTFDHNDFDRTGSLFFNGLKSGRSGLVS